MTRNFQTPAPHVSTRSNAPPQEPDWGRARVAKQWADDAEAIQTARAGAGRRWGCCVGGVHEGGAIAAVSALAWVDVCVCWRLHVVGGVCAVGACTIRAVTCTDRAVAHTAHTHGIHARTRTRTTQAVEECPVDCIAYMCTSTRTHTHGTRAHARHRPSRSAPSTASRTCGGSSCRCWST